MPAELRLLRGTHRADRHGPATPEPSAAATGGSESFWEPDAGTPAAEIYDFIMESGVGPAVSASDSPMLVLLCETWGLCLSSLKQVQASPTDKVARTAFVSYSQLFDRLACRFGLTPADRARLRLPSAGKTIKRLAGNA